MRSDPGIRLAVLDMAGTTVRDDGVVERAFVTALTDMGFDPGGPALAGHLEYVRRTMGQSKIVVFRAIFGGDEARAADATARFERAFADEVAGGAVVPLPGAEAAMSVLRDGGVKVCLTTGFSEATQDALLDALGWHDAVDLALAPGPGLRGRPYPDLVLHAVIALEIDAVQDVAVVGDTASDLVAGTRAGASVVAGVLTGAHDRATLAAAPHTHLLDSVADLPAILR